MKFDFVLIVRCFVIVDGSICFWYEVFCLLKMFCVGIDMMWIWMFFDLSLFWVFKVNLIFEFVVMMILLSLFLVFDKI